MGFEEWPCKTQTIFFIRLALWNPPTKHFDISTPPTNHNLETHIENSMWRGTGGTNHKTIDFGSFNDFGLGRLMFLKWFVIPRASELRRLPTGSNHMSVSYFNTWRWLIFLIPGQVQEHFFSPKSQKKWRGFQGTNHTWTHPNKEFRQTMSDQSHLLPDEQRFSSDQSNFRLHEQRFSPTSHTLYTQFFVRVTTPKFTWKKHAIPNDMKNNPNVYQETLAQTTPGADPPQRMEICHPVFSWSTPTKHSNREARCAHPGQVAHSSEQGKESKTSLGKMMKNISPDVGDDTADEKSDARCLWWRWRWSWWVYL